MRAALVDCTAAAAIVDAYPEFIRATSISSRPTNAYTLPWRRYVTLQKLLARRRRMFLCDTNVGAGLPSSRRCAI
jgi:hypothetical protein